jgi:hypothetical protein
VITIDVDRPKDRFGRLTLPLDTKVTPYQMYRERLELEHCRRDLTGIRIGDRGRRLIEHEQPRSRPLPGDDPAFTNVPGNPLDAGPG